MNSVINQLKQLGFAVDHWQFPLEGSAAGVLQITDNTGITFYMPESATFDECERRYQEKLDEFYGAKMVRAQFQSEKQLTK